MLVKTQGENLTVLFSTYVPQKASEHVVKSFDNNGVIETKTAADGSGRVQHRTNLDALHVDENGVVDRKEREVTLSVLIPIDVNIGTYYKASGDVWITHYMNDARRMCVSIVAETLVPLNQPKSVASIDK